MERIHLWEWRDAKIHCSEWPESPFDQHTQCLYTTKALVLAASFRPLEHAVAFHITHDLIFNVEQGGSNRLKSNNVTGLLMISKPKGGGGGKKGENAISTQPQRPNWDTQGKKSNLLCSVAPPGGKRSDGWGDGSGDGKPES